MALISISAAAKLTGKSRTTLHRYISTGKLSLCTGEKGVKKLDTSELLRVFGGLNGVTGEHSNTVTSEHYVTVTDTPENKQHGQLKQEIEHLKSLVSAQQSHIDSLKQALLLIEYKNIDIKKSSGIKRFWNLFGKK